MYMMILWCLSDTVNAIIEHIKFWGLIEEKNKYSLSSVPTLNLRGAVLEQLQTQYGKY